MRIDEVHGCDGSLTYETGDAGDAVEFWLWGRIENSVTSEGSDTAFLLPGKRRIVGLFKRSSHQSNSIENDGSEEGRAANIGDP